MTLGDALDGLDRRVLGRHADPGPPSKRPVRTALLFVGLSAGAQFLGLLAIGFTLAEAIGSLLTYLAGAAISAPFLLWFFRRRSTGDGPDAGGPHPDLPAAQSLLGVQGRCGTTSKAGDN